MIFEYAHNSDCLLKKPHLIDEDKYDLVNLQILCQKLHVLFYYKTSVYLLFHIQEGLDLDKVEEYHYHPPQTFNIIIYNGIN